MEILGLEGVKRWLALLTLVAAAGCGSSNQSSRTCTDEQCGEFGSCQDTDGGSMCVCDDGYAGDDCSKCAKDYVKSGKRCVLGAEALGQQLCMDDPCGDHGTCDGTSGEVQCECEQGYTGDDCSECDQGYHQDGDACVADETCDNGSCPDNATCDDTGGVITCECNDGWAGADCNTCAAGYHDEGGDCVEDTSCGANTCPNGTCDDSSGTPVCTCDPGFTGEHCDECDQGYHQDGAACVADEVCGDGSCPPNATCDDTGGVITCTCMDGYTGDDCSECEAPLVLGADGTCLEPCADGLVMGADGACTLECDADHTLVDVASVNPNTVPVPDGYELSPPSTIIFPDGGTLMLQSVGTLVCIPLGYTCDQYDPCGGSSAGHCDDQSGVPVCVCDMGYVGFSCNECDQGYHPDGAACVADVPCTPDSCSGKGTCDDTMGEPECTCDTGSAGSNCGGCATGYHADETGACVLDEVCGDCGGHGSCQVIGGLAMCTCFLGYVGDDCGACDGGYHDEAGTCAKDKFCTSTTCSGRGACAEVDGETVCDPCDPGYDGSNCGECADGFTRAGGECVPLPNPDGCMPNPCNGGTCDDSSGTVVCTCPFPYTGSRCQSCVSRYVKSPQDGSCVPSSCGDGILDAKGGEECDPGPTTKGDCPYGETSCQVCGGPAAAPPPRRVIAGSGDVPTTAGEPVVQPVVEPVVQPVVEPVPQPAPDPTSPYDPANYCKVVPGLPHYCGDSVTDPEEGCDDGPPAAGCSLDANGNMVGDCSADNADGCLATCQTNTCGDGFVNPATEACDDGVNDALYGEVGGCAAGCVPAPYCGDDLVTNGEQCDDGNRSNLDSCLNNCRDNICGDGMVFDPSGTDPDACDDGTANTAYCYTDTGPLLNAVDAVTNDLADCTVCLPAGCGQDSCTSAAGVAQYCGDGVINGGEECDPGERILLQAPAVAEVSSIYAFCDGSCIVQDADYGYCGDGLCTSSENNPAQGSYCDADCHCGNGVCDADETANFDKDGTYCPQDCATCCDGQCTDAEAVGGVFGCPYDCYCGDGVCSIAAEEDYVEGYCAADCCGDGVCTANEANDDTCPDDCCGNGVCSPVEDQDDSCPADCCGDGTCSPAEDQSGACTDDCFCGNGTCEASEACDVCLDDCGPCGPG